MRYDRQSGDPDTWAADKLGGHMLPVRVRLHLGDPTFDVVEGRLDSIQDATLVVDRGEDRDLAVPSRTVQAIEV